MLVPRKYHSLIVAAVLLILSLAILSYSASRLSETWFLRKTVLEAAAPAEDAINISLKGLHDAWKRYFFLVGLEDENRRLRKQNASLSDQLNLYREGHIEGMRLRKLLNLTEGLSNRTVAARVVDRSRTSLFKTILVTTEKGPPEKAERLRERGVQIWTLGMKEGKVVQMEYTLPIKFKLDKKSAE